MLRLVASSRQKALEAGYWETHDGRLVRLCDLHDAHLVNALLKVLGDARPWREVRPLAEEIERRHLRAAAEAEAARREGK